MCWFRVVELHETHTVLSTRNPSWSTHPPPFAQNQLSVGENMGNRLDLPVVSAVDVPPAFKPESPSERVFKHRPTLSCLLTYCQSRSHSTGHIRQTKTDRRKTCEDGNHLCKDDIVGLTSPKTREACYLPEGLVEEDSSCNKITTRQAKVPLGTDRQRPDGCYEGGWDAQQGFVVGVRRDASRKHRRLRLPIQWLVIKNLLGVQQGDCDCQGKNQTV
jgi:hypothetical protein